jgi:anti-sigma regulatory factor (Ser/Thr protein kinase)
LVAEALPHYRQTAVPGRQSARKICEELSDAVSLMTSELVTNAVIHAPAEERVIEVVLWRADGMLWLAVSDCGEPLAVRRPCPAHPMAPAFPDPDSEHGRGLYLVDALADVWTVVPRPTVGKSVVAGLRLPEQQLGTRTGECAGGSHSQRVVPV